MSNALGFGPGSAPGAAPRRSLAAVAGLLTLMGLGASGCIIVDDSRNHDGTVTVDQSTPVYVHIDADQVLHTDLGQGVGLFVEYATGGGWHLWTSCDTDISDATCSFQAHAIGDADFAHVTPENFGPGDSVELAAADELWFYAETGSESDGVTFTSEPGADIELEVWVDGNIEPQFIYWVGDGVVHEGASDSPVVFEPTSA
jgi:hypothetical protein